MAPSPGKMKVVKPPEACEDSEVMRLRDALNEQNINTFRMEMAERWRLQEESDKTIRKSIENLALTETSHWEHVHQFEKKIIYATIANIAAAAISVGSRFLP